MIDQYNIIGNILFSEELAIIQQKLKQLRKDKFDPYDRIVLRQDIVDEYPYTDAVGSKLVDIQKIINQVDISNCFFIIVTANKDIAQEIDFVTKFYSIDSNPIEFMIVDGDYKKNIKQYKDTVCQKLWNHLYVGTDGNVNPCCLADHRFPLGNIDQDNISDIINTNAEIIRSQMLNGYRNRSCASCYEKEDAGIQSQRIPFDPLKKVVDIRDIDIRINNICNFKCRMCSEYFSSSIQQETRELYGKDAILGSEKISLYGITKQARGNRLEKVLPWITKNLTEIYFAGGEPLIMDEHYEILNRLIDIKNTNLEIKYNTNLSTLKYKKENVIDKWCQFDNVTVGASIDASGKVAEYVRHGTIWQNIIDNIMNIKHNAPHVKLKITSAVSSLTIENLIELQQHWIAEKMFDVEDFRLQALISPEFLSLAALPLHHKDRLSRIIKKHIEKFSNTSLAQQWNDVLIWMNNNDCTFALEEFAQRTRALDVHRKESFEEIFPQYLDLI